MKYLAALFVLLFTTPAMAVSYDFFTWKSDTILASAPTYVTITASSSTVVVDLEVVNSGQKQCFLDFAESKASLSIGATTADSRLTPTGIYSPTLDTSSGKYFKNVALQSTTDNATIEIRAITYDYSFSE